MDRKKVYDKYNGHCAYCGQKIDIKDMQVDHLHPKRLGGTDDMNNLMPSCRMCNHYKRANKLESFRSMIADIPKKLSQEYLVKVALGYNLIELKPKDIVFYFEKEGE